MRKLRNSRLLNRSVMAGCALLIAGASAWARLPIPYEQRGAVASVDENAHLIVLAAPPKPKFRLGKIVKPTVFVWTQDTKFIRNGQPADAAGLALGENVHLYYRYPGTKQPPVLVKVLWPDRN